MPDRGEFPAAERRISFVSVRGKRVMVGIGLKGTYSSMPITLDSVL